MKPKTTPKPYLGEEPVSSGQADHPPYLGDALPVRKKKPGRRVVVKKIVKKPSRKSAFWLKQAQSMARKGKRAAYLHAMQKAEQTMDQELVDVPVDGGDEVVTADTGVSEGGVAAASPANESAGNHAIEGRLAAIEKMIEILPDRLIQALTHGGGHA